jgi:peptidylprolyl isomerase
MADDEKTEDAEDPTPAAKPADPGQRNKVVGLIAAFAVLAIIVVVVLVGQGGGDEGSGDTDLESKPTIEAKEGEPPTELESTDIVTGDGAEATPGSEVTVQYVGVLFEDGTEFDASWDRGDTFKFGLGKGQVIPGWDQGVAGMKVGGRRELVIPSDLAYGPQGQPPDIPPDSALVFVIDLLDVQPAPAAPGGAVPPPTP